MHWKILRLLVATLAGLSVALTTLPASAAGASIYLSANHSTLSNGSTLIVAVYMNGGGTPVNTVEADLNYPASKLQYVGLNYSGGAFSINTPGDGGGNGVVSVQNGTTNPISGSGLVATVTFRALSSSGSAYIGVSGSSSLVSSQTNQPIPFSSSGVTVNFGTSYSSGSNSSHSSSSAPSAPAAPAAPKDTTPPVISSIKIKDLSPFRATVTWTTNESASSEVDYGLDSAYGLSASSSTMGTAHSVTLDSTFLTPETVFHYHVKSADASGNVGVGPDEHFSLPGVPVTIVVLGASGKPEAGATVTLDGATATTDRKGQVILPSSLGNKKVTTTFQGVTVQKPITVARTAKPLPPYQLDLARQPLNHWMLTSIGLFIVILVMLGIDAVLFGSRFFVRLAGLHLAPALPVLHVPHMHLGLTAASDMVSAPQTSAAPHSSPGTTPAPDLTPAPTEAQAAAPPITHFNVQTVGDAQISPSLRAIDNIQPLSVRRTPTPSSVPPAEVRRITITETTADEAKTESDLSKTEPKPAKPAPAKKRHARKSRKLAKKPAKTPTAPTLVSPPSA